MFGGRGQSCSLCLVPGVPQAPQVQQDQGSPMIPAPFPGTGAQAFRGPRRLHSHGINCGAGHGSHPTGASSQALGQLLEVLV